MKPIDETARLICTTVATGVARYAEVAGTDMDDMPEYFLPAYVLDHLGSGLTMTLETSARKLWEWNEDARQRMRLPCRSDANGPSQEYQTLFG